MKYYQMKHKTGPDVVSGNKNSVNVVPVNPLMPDDTNVSQGEQLKNSYNDLPMNTENKNKSIVDDKTGKSIESPSKDNTPSKPKKGEFHTRIVGIRRQRDPRAFECSCCSKHTITL